MNEDAPLLPREFFDREVRAVARDLLGACLVVLSREGRLSGRIVETEAYLAEGDSACHGARGRTPGNAAMFGPPGRAYVYPIHSRHCLNFVTGPVGHAAAVLLRAVEPLEGLPFMRERRRADRIRDLARGPARLCEAFGIDRSFDGRPLVPESGIFLLAGGPVDEEHVVVTSRIGVTSAKEMPLRYVVADDPFASGPRHMSRPRSTKPARKRESK